jgi:hypothetical protein
MRVLVTILALTLTFFVPASFSSPDSPPEIVAMQWSDAMASGIVTID